MKRDWELVRKILLKVEELNSRNDCVSVWSIDGYETQPELVGYHMKIMKEAGLIKAIESNADDACYELIATELTWHGHEFLDSIRADTIWSKTIALIKNKGGELTFETIKVAATTIMTSILQ